MRVLLGYGALRDAESTNRSVMSYVKLAYHAPRARTSSSVSSQEAGEETAVEAAEAGEAEEAEVVEVVEWLPSWPLPAGAWRPLRLEVVEEVAEAVEGGGVEEGRAVGRLSLWLDGVPLLRNISLPGWTPAVGWRAGVYGSREGPYDTQWVDNLLLSSGALRSAAEVAADTTYYGPYCPGN